MKDYIINDVIDWFGTDVDFSDAADGEVTARVNVNLQAMRLWALQYGPRVRVLSPQKLVEGIKEDLRQAEENYMM